MGASNDQMIARMQAELDEKRGLQDGLVETAQAENRDLTSTEMELYQRASTRMTEIEQQLEPMREAALVSERSTRRMEELAAQLTTARNPNAPGAVEYRSAGAYIADLYYGQLGDQDAAARLATYQRAAAHQTTADNPGLLPETIVGPVVNFVEAVRPIVATLGPVDLGGGAWSYARVTQHTQVGKQAGEKTELASRKMTVTKTPLGADTFGGYVNVSKQDINRTSPAILDMVVNDLAEQYAIQTELDAGTTLTAAATPGPTIPANPTALNIASAIWAAAGQVYAATKGQGQTVVAVAPDKLGVVGPLFPPINPQNAFSTGFDASGLGQGPQGSIAGLVVIASAGLAAGTVLVYSTAAAKCFEYKYGNLQVVEPSVWGVQVGYAGDFDSVVIEPAGVVKVTSTP